MEERKNNENKKIEIVKGKSKDLKISDVKDNLAFEVHDNKTIKNGEIVVPENKQ